MTNHSEITEYNSLNDIRLKKETIRKEIDADDAKIQTLWNSLFTKPEILSRNASPSKRLQGGSRSIRRCTVGLETLPEIQTSEEMNHIPFWGKERCLGKRYFLVTQKGIKTKKGRRCDPNTLLTLNLIL